MTSDRTVSVGVSSDGHVSLVFEVAGETRTTVDMPWRDAAQLMCGLSAAVIIMSRREGLTDHDLNTLMTSVYDQAGAEVVARLRAAL